MDKKLLGHARRRASGGSNAIRRANSKGYKEKAKAFSRKEIAEATASRKEPV